MGEKVINAALLGLGTVGTGVYKVLKNQEEEMTAKIGCKVKIRKILVRNLEKAAGKVDDPAVLTNSWEDIKADPSIDIIIELIGGIEPARTYILDALHAGKHVVTANKDLIAVHGKELMDTARASHVDFLFEAAVAGGIPIIRPLKQCLAGNNITEIMGIINGTTNFILTKMKEDGMDFGEALQLATDLGYAEADPTADIEGYDAGRKLAIMASIAFHTSVTFDDVFTEGITKITAKDMRYAKEMGCSIKLLGIAKNTETGIEVKVHPTMIPENHPLAAVNDSFNAVFVHGDAVDDAMFYGRGAGKLPTASAVVADVARNMLFHCNGRIGCSCYKNLPIKQIGDTTSRYYIRMRLEDRAGTLAAMAGVFAENDASIAILLQKETIENDAEIVVVTHEVAEKKFMDAIKKFSSMEMVKEISSIIRVYALGNV